MASCSSTTVSYDNESAYATLPCINGPYPDGSESVTYWQLNNDQSYYSIGPHSALTVSFTGTKPNCYSAKDACNVYFYSWPYASANSNDIELRYILNMNDLGGGSHIPASGGGVTQGWDMSQYGHAYIDDGENWFSVYNNSSGTVQLDSFEIIRTYKMTGLQYNDSSYCTGAVNTGSSGSLDPERADYPCSGATGGGRSYAEYADKDFANKTLPSGQCLQWNWDWTNHTGSNYQGPEVCLFNFNQVWQTSNTSSPTYLEAYLNGSLVQQYYISKVSGSGHGSFPSIEIMRSFSAYYNDRGANSMVLKNNGPATIQMSSDGINIYRTYKSSAV